MSGPFYGSLAASASVFVAILTALLVNNYVEIKSQRRQTETELEQVKEELKKFNKQRDNHEETIDELTGRREKRFKQNARERVSDFIEKQVPSQISQPIEKLDIDILYHHLSDYHNFDSPEDIEESDEHYHRQLLEEHYDQIEQAVLGEITSSFAEDYDITGRRSRVTGSDSDALEEAIEKVKDKEDDGDEDSSSSPGDIEVSAEGVDEEPEPVELDEFIEDFKEEYGLDSLRKETREALEQQYNEFRDRSQMDRVQSSIERIRESRSSFGLNNVFDTPDITTGLGIQEKARLQEARKDLAHAENQIETLQRRKKRLEDEKSGLNAEDLIPVLTANVATIIFSVVVPIFAYLLFATNTTVTVPSWAWIISHTEVNVFLSWLLGLIIVFVEIYLRITGRDLKKYLPQRLQ